MIELIIVAFVMLGFGFIALYFAKGEGEMRNSFCTKCRHSQWRHQHGVCTDVVDNRRICACTYDEFVSLQKMGETCNPQRENYDRIVSLDEQGRRTVNFVRKGWRVDNG